MYNLLSVLSVLIIISTVPIVSAEVIRGESTVPDWVKNTAGWWASEQIPDSAFLQGIQYLIKEGIMIVEIPTEIDSEAAEEVPGWVKNTAGWWAEDKIHDTTFVSGIKYLIGKGIIVVEQEVEEPVEEIVEIKDFYMEVNGGSCSYCLNWAYVGEKYYFQIETQDSQHGKYIDDVKINAKIISKDGELRHDFGEVTTDDGVYRNNIIIPSMDWYAENILSVTGEYYGVEKTIEKEFEVFKKKKSGGPWQVRSMVALDAETDDANGFVISGAHGVETYTIGSSTYAIVAIQGDDGVQIIDISDPTAIVAKDFETDGETYTELDGAWAVDTFTIGSSTYAIVASFVDDGVQIIDISDPTAIVAKDAETDEANSFTELDGAHGVETYTIDSSTYAIVASRSDNGVQIIDISDPTAIVAKDAETDGANSFTMLKGADDVSTFVIGSSTYAIVASRSDHGVQIIDISIPTAIVAKDTATDTDDPSSLELRGATSVDTFTIGSSTYAIVVSQNDDGVQMIDISDPDNIVMLDAETDGVNGFTELDGAEDVEIFTCGSRTYAMVVSAVDDGVQLIDISNPANIIAVDAETDGVNGFTELDGVYNIEPFKIGSTQYAIATSYTDSGIQMIGMDCSRS